MSRHIPHNVYKKFNNVVDKVRAIHKRGDDDSWGLMIFSCYFKNQQKIQKNSQNSYNSSQI